jgi:hypothetical protein
MKYKYYLRDTKSPQKLEKNIKESEPTVSY